MRVQDSRTLECKRKTAPIHPERSRSPHQMWRSKELHTRLLFQTVNGTSHLSCDLDQRQGHATLWSLRGGFSLRPRSCDLATDIKEHVGWQDVREGQTKSSNICNTHNADCWETHRNGCLLDIRRLVQTLFSTFEFLESHMRSKGLESTLTRTSQGAFAGLATRSAMTITSNLSGKGLRG